MAREVLHVVGSMKRGGAETWLMHVLRRMDCERVRFTFCALDERPGSLETEVRALRGRVVVCPLRQGWPPREQAGCQTLRAQTVIWVVPVSSAWDRL